jgi:putative transposase
MYRVRREQIKTFLYTVANKLFKKYDIVGIGDYTPSGGGISRKMRRAMNNQSLIGRLKEVLTWVAIRSGKRYLEWAEKGSTRTCHLCGYKVAEGINPDIREWTCSTCHKNHIRDENAALNGLQRVLNKLELPCSGRLEITLRRVGL